MPFRRLVGPFPVRSLGEGHEYIGHNPEDELRQRHVQTLYPGYHRLRNSEGFLVGEWYKSAEGGLTPDCRSGPCDHCGVCDHKTIKPITRMNRAKKSFRSGREVFSPADSFSEKRLRIQFTKLGSRGFCPIWSFPPPDPGHCPKRSIAGLLGRIHPPKNLFRLCHRCGHGK